MELRVKLLTGRDRIVGLMNTKKAFPVMLKTRFGIHTFGLRFPIDVLVLDKDGRVVKLSRNLKPNRIFVWNPVFDKVVELPVGEIEKNRIRIGTEVRITLYN